MMATAIVLPELGAGDEVLRVSCWLVDPGDRVEVGDRIVEVRLQGMTFDVAAETAGVLTRIAKPFDSVIVAGGVLGWIDDDVAT